MLLVTATDIKQELKNLIQNLAIDIVKKVF